MLAVARPEASSYLIARLAASVKGSIRSAIRVYHSQCICLSVYLSLPSMLAGAGSEGQETASKISDIAASVKGFVFYTTTFLLALPLFAIMMLLTPFVLLLDKHRRLAQHFVNNIWAKVSTLLYYRVQVCESICTKVPIQYTKSAAVLSHIERYL